MGPSLQLSMCVLFSGFLGLCKATRDPYATCQISSWSDNRRRSYGDFSPTMQLATMTLTYDPLTLKLVHGVLVSQGPFPPSLVFVGLFVFPLGGGTGQTDRRTGSTHDPPFRKNGPTINVHTACLNASSLRTRVWARWEMTVCVTYRCLLATSALMQV